MRLILITAVAVMATGCANLMQTGSITEAYEQYDKQNYEKTLELITQARSIGRLTPDLLAELSFLKAQTYEQMGLHEDAKVLYTYLREQHSDSQYGYLAKEALVSNDG